MRDTSVHGGRACCCPAGQTSGGEFDPDQTKVARRISDRSLLDWESESVTMAAMFAATSCLILTV